MRSGLASSSGRFRREALADGVDLLARQLDRPGLLGPVLLDSFLRSIATCMRKLTAFLHDRLGHRAEA